MKLIKSILALAATVFLGASAMAADQYVPISLAYADADHAETAVVHNHYHHQTRSDYNYVFSYAIASGDTLVHVSQTQPAESTYDAYTTIEAQADSGTARVNVNRKNGDNPVKLDMGFDVTLAAKRVLYVGKTLTGVRCNYEISGIDTLVTGSTGSWISSSEGSVTVTGEADENNYRNYDLTVTGDEIGWGKATVTFESTGKDDHEGITYTRWFQVRDKLQPQAFTNRQVLVGTELSTISLADVVMVDSKGAAVEGSWQWVNASKTLDAGAYVEQAIFTASGDNAEFYDAATVDVTIDVGVPKKRTTGVFGDPIGPSEGTRTLTDCEGWKTAKVVGDDLGGVTVLTGSDWPAVNVENATRGGKVTIWVENDETIWVYEGIVYQEKVLEVTGYKNSTMHLTLKADVAGVWTAQSDGETIATVAVPSESTSEIEAAITCKDEGNTQLTIKNDYVVYTVAVNVDGEKPVEPGKFNLAQGEKAVMSLHYLNGQTPTARYFYVSNDVNDVVGFLVARDGSWQYQQETLNVTFMATTDDGSAKIGVWEHNQQDPKQSWNSYTSLPYVSEAVAMPKRIVYLGETNQLYCLSSESAAWTVVPAEDGIVSVTVPAGATAEGYAKVAGEKVGTTTFTIGNTTEVEEGFSKGVTYTINYEVRGMPEADGTLTGDADLEPGAALSTIGVAGAMKDAKGNAVDGTFAWVDGTQTFDKEGTETVEAIFTPANSSYDSVKVKVVVKVSEGGWDPATDPSVPASEKGIGGQLGEASFKDLSVWAQANSVKFWSGDRDEDYLNAFLLNCDPGDADKESDAYAIVSIKQLDDGSWDVQARTTNTDDEPYYGMSVILGSESIEDPDWDEANVDGPFFKAELRIKPVVK